MAQYARLVLFNASPAIVQLCVPAARPIVLSLTVLAYAWLAFFLSTTVLSVDLACTAAQVVSHPIDVRLVIPLTNDFLVSAHAFAVLVSLI